MARLELLDPCPRCGERRVSVEDCAETFGHGGLDFGCEQCGCMCFEMFEDGTLVDPLSEKEKKDDRILAVLSQRN